MTTNKKVSFLKSKGFENVEAKCHGKELNIIFFNPAGSSFDLYFGEDGRIEAGTCVSIDGGDELNFMEIHCEGHPIFEEVDYDNLLDW